jgi:hypothetical protein
MNSQIEDVIEDILEYDYNNPYFLYKFANCFRLFDIFLLKHIFKSLSNKFSKKKDVHNICALVVKNKT